MKPREFWRYAVRIVATMLSTEVGAEIAVGEFYLPFFRNGWKLAPPPPKPEPKPEVGLAWGPADYLDDDYPTADGFDAPGTEEFGGRR